MRSATGLRRSWYMHVACVRARAPTPTPTPTYSTVPAPHPYPYPYLLPVPLPLPTLTKCASRDPVSVWRCVSPPEQRKRTWLVELELGLGLG